MTARSRTQRDPEGRRRVIVEAAAAVLLESGMAGFTHRGIAGRAGVPLGSTTYYFDSLEALKKAALEHLSQVLDQGLVELARELADCDDLVRTLARLFHGYLSDPARVRADAAFYVLSAENPELRPLATRWSDGLAGVLAPIVGPATARAIAVYGDGAMLHATLHETPLSEDELAEAFARLMGATHE